MIDAHGGPSSAITKVPAGETSYAHRNALLKYEFYDRTSETYPADGFDFLNGWVATITETMKNTTYSPFGMYINYADPRLNRTTAGQTYYGKSLPRLQNLKAVYDPAELFYYPQSVQPVAV